MKRVLIVFLCLAVLTVVILVVVIVKKKFSTPIAAEQSTTPAWLNELPPEDSIWGIGKAKLSSVMMSMSAAEARARVSISSQLVNITRNTLAEYGSNADIEGFSVVTSSENVSRSILNVELSGIRVLNRWQGASDETFWYLVEFKKSSAREIITGIFNNLEKENPHFIARDALVIFDKHLTKGEKPLVIGE